MTFDDFQHHLEEHRAEGAERLVLPVHKRLSADLITPVSAFLSLRAGGSYPFLLESVEGGQKLARYSFLGRDPYCILRAEGSDVAIEERRPDVATLPEVLGTGTIFEALEAMADAYTEADVPGLPRLTGGAVGYLGYDTVRLLEGLPDAPPDDLHLPDALWCFYDQIVAFDHVRHQLVLMASAFIDPATDERSAFEAAQEKIDTLEEALRRSAPRPRPVVLTSEEARSNTPRAQFEEAVRTAKDYIRAGDIFQVVLSQRLALSFEGDRFNLYRALRQVNPSPYLFYLDFEEFALAGSSPEVLVRVEAERAEVLPIAGTRPRGADEEEDTRLADELVADEKERAEHVMLVDLGRNDLSRVCEVGTVEVERYANVERFSHVMHLVSSVSGRLQAGCGPADALAACFPAGTVSGAPKVRAMEIIDELEPTRRGIYAGAVGYLDFRGTLDTCIAIRTMVIQGRKAYVQAGAGIVADSDPAAEYEETLAKAQALREAVRRAALL